MDEITQFMEEHIPKMDSPEKVYELFKNLGYNTLTTDYRGKEVWNLKDKDKELVEEIFTIANYDKKLQIFLIKLKSFSSSIIRELPAYFERVVQYPFFVFTPDYQNYTFVLVEKIREDVGVFKRKLIKLNLDRENPFYTDKWILSEIAIKNADIDPNKVFNLIKNAFGIQKVTEKFFSEYKNNFDNLTKFLKDNNKGVALFHDESKLFAFAQRFLGRLMFLYFLQKKGWLAGDKKFISNMFEKTKREDKNFYQTILEPLFFDILNRKRADNESQFGKIPFLNGGLFEKDYNELIYISNNIIEKIINFLNSYNFTVSEEMPLEVEVAVNPEMLGKIFESMLPEYDRGKKGTFYTPRSIVHYMCRESIKNYLYNSCNIQRYKIINLVEKSDSRELTYNESKSLYQALADVKILDPACGSGAFLVGMMQEIIQLKSLLAENLKIKISQSEMKREIVRSNIYGIDIEIEAIEIAKLRLWLSLVVDEEIDKVEPLPNLDYKLATGNSLTETLKGKKIFQSREYQDSLFENESQKLTIEFDKLKENLTNEMDINKKNEIRKKLENIEWKLIEQGLNSEVETKMQQVTNLCNKYNQAKVEMPSSEKKKVSNIMNDITKIKNLINDSIKSGSKPFFLPQIHFAEVFAKRGGFDIVIANPPYVSTQKLSDLSYRDDLKLHYNFIDDLYVHFTFRAFELARNKGVISFITSNTYFTLSWKQRMRELLQNYHINEIIITPKAFKATVDTAIFIAEKESLNDYNITFIDAREVGDSENESWEDKLIVFEELREIENYDTFASINLKNRELEVMFNRHSDIYQFRVPINLYKNAIKKVFFSPTQNNLKLYEKFMPIMNELYEKWWNKIKSSKDIQKNKEELIEYHKTLKSGDITILGLITDGGIGLQTGDNGRFLAFLSETAEANKIERKLAELEQKWKKNEPKIYDTYKNLLNDKTRNDAIDALRKEFGDKTLGLTRGFIYKVIQKQDIFDVSNYLTNLESDIKENMRKVIIFGGIPESAEDIKNLWKLSKLPDDIISLDNIKKKKIEKEYVKLIGRGNWIVLEKNTGQEEIYWAPNIYYIDWSRESVKWLFNNSGKNGTGMPVIRNPEYYFKSGITFGRTSGNVLKPKIATGSIFDTETPLLINLDDKISLKYLAAILNSNLALTILNEFINHTVHIQLNDLRLLPIVIPPDSQKKEIEILVDEIIEIQKKRYATGDEEVKSDYWQKIQKIQYQLDKKIEKIYGM